MSVVEVNYFSETPFNSLQVTDLQKRTWGGGNSKVPQGSQTLFHIKMGDGTTNFMATLANMSSRFGPQPTKDGKTVLMQLDLYEEKKIAEHQAYDDALRRLVFDHKLKCLKGTTLLEILSDVNQLNINNFSGLIKRGKAKDENDMSKGRYLSIQFILPTTKTSKGQLLIDPNLCPVEDKNGKPFFNYQSFEWMTALMNKKYSEVILQLEKAVVKDGTIKMTWVARKLVVDEEQIAQPVTSKKRTLTQEAPEASAPAAAASSAAATPSDPSAKKRALPAGK